MVLDKIAFANPISEETLQSDSALAKEWRTVDKFTWLNRIRQLLLSATQKHLLHAMAIYADADGSNVFPSMQTLASDMSMDRKTVNTHAIQLRDEGWLIPEDRVSKFNHTIVYRINIDKILSFNVDENSDVIEKHDRGVTSLPKGESLPYREGHDTLTERGVVTLPKGAQRPTTRSSNQIIYTRPELPDPHHHPVPATLDDEERQSDPFKELYLSWKEKAIPKGVLKLMMSEGATIEYWKVRLEHGEGRKVKNPTAYLRKCMENDPPGEFEPPLPRHQQYTTGKWADFIES